MFHDYTGTVYNIVMPPQGTNSHITLLEAERGDFIVKSVAPSSVADLEWEAKVLLSLEAYQPMVPGFIAREGDYFLFTYLKGVGLASKIQEASDPAVQRTLAAEHGRFLERIHTWTPSRSKQVEWIGNSDWVRSDDWITEALWICETNISEGSIMGISEYSTWAGSDAEEMYAYLNDQRGEYENELVWGHGDWCLPNALVQGNSVTAAIDWGAGAYYDRRYDLATALWSLRYNLRDAPGVNHCLESFLQGYGYDDSVESLRYFEAIYALL